MKKILLFCLVSLVSCVGTEITDCYIYNVYQNGIKISSECKCGYVERSFTDDSVFYKYMGVRCK